MAVSDSETNNKRGRLSGLYMAGCSRLSQGWPGVAGTWKPGVAEKWPKGGGEWPKSGRHSQPGVAGSLSSTGGCTISTDTPGLALEEASVTEDPELEAR